MLYGFCSICGSQYTINSFASRRVRPSCSKAPSKNAAVSLPFTQKPLLINYKAFKSTPCIPLIHIAELFFSAIKHKSTSLQTYELLTYEFIIHCFLGIVKRICCKTFMFKYEKAPPKRRLLYAAFCSVFFSLSQSAVFLFNPWRFRIAYSSASLSPTNISLRFARVIAV